MKSEDSMDTPNDLFPLDLNDFFHSNDLEEIIHQDAADQNLCLVGNIPTREEYPGPYNFTLTMDTTGQKWVYSEPLAQVFIGMNKIIVLNFRTEIELPPNQYFIRALPVYSSNDHVNVPVNRCTFHSCDDDPQSQAHQVQNHCLCKEFRNVGHVVRAECKEAIYCYDEHSGRHSVLIPVDRPQPGSDKLEIPYSFACKTSCYGGMQRRAIHVIFTLETSTGAVLGRRVLGVKICSCPKRDRDRQEKDYFTEKRGDPQKKRPLENNDQVSKKIKQESLEQLQHPEIGSETVAQDIKDLKSNFDQFSKTMNDLFSIYGKMVQKMDLITKKHQISYS